MPDFIQNAKTVIDIEKNAIAQLGDNLDNQFNHACQVILECQGKIILTGIGKSGHIAKKIASTFASTGTPAFFVHPSEAGHGDLGMINKNDVVIAISYSGNSDEILMILPLIKRFNISIICLTGHSNSAMANMADIHLNIGVKKEACPHNLAPTASTTTTLVMGDALAISVLKARGFSAEDFSRTHPSGVLGKRLLTLVSDIMQTGDSIPIVSADLELTDVLLVMTKKRMGFVIASEHNQVLGVFTDGDLRRILQIKPNFIELKMKDVMLKTCKTIGANKPAVLAVEIMEKYKINALPVVDENQKLVGAINTHDLLEAKIM